MNHGPVRTVPSLSVLSSPQSYKKNKPLSTPPRIPLTTGSTERFSMPCLWIVSTPRKDSKSKSYMRLVHGITQRSNMDDKIVVNSGQMREKIWIIRTSQNRTWDGPEDFPNVSALVSGVNLHRAVSYIPCRTFIPACSYYFA